MHDRNPVPAKTINALTLNNASAHLMYIINERQNMNANSDEILRNVQMLYLINTIPTQMNAVAWLDSLILLWAFSFYFCSILSHIKFDAMHSISLNRQTKIVTCITQLESIIVSTVFKMNKVRLSLVCRTKVNNRNEKWQSNKEKQKFKEKIASSFLIYSNLLCTHPEKVVSHHVYVCVNEHVSFFLFFVFLSVTRNNFKVLIYFKISYLIYAELFFSSASITFFLNLVFLSTEFAMMEWLFFLFFLAEYFVLLQKITEQNCSIHCSTEKSKKFFVRAFVLSLAGSFHNKFYCLFTEDTLTNRRKCVFLSFTLCVCAHKIGRFHYLSTCQGFVVGANFIERMSVVTVASNGGSEGGHGTISITLLEKLWENNTSAHKI